MLFDCTFVWLQKFNAMELNVEPDKRMLYWKVGVHTNIFYSCYIYIYIYSTAAKSICISLYLLQRLYIN